jgi:ABC-type multidrug transport system permease subunit
MDLFLPAAVIFVPVLLGRTIAEEEAGFNFAQYAHTSNFAGFLLIGGGCFLLASKALWNFGNWLKAEMRSGTLESLYLTAAPMPIIVAGVALAFIIYSALIFGGAMLVGAFLYQITFQTNHLPIALAFLIVGLPSLYGLALVYGALVLRLKETEAFVQIALWITTFLSGVYFPISVFPPALKFISLIFPPTWLTHGLRSALLDTPYLSNSWLLDLSVLAFFCLVAPLVGYWTFAKTEKALRSNSGLSEF